MAHGGHRLSTTALIAVLFTLTAAAGGTKHTVGDSIWSIPPTNNFYNNWSSSQSFLPGDVLFFDFESEMYNVMQVSMAEYEDCTSNNPLKSYNDGPAMVNLTDEGFLYFTCDFFNYCSLGLKLTVSVTLPGRE